MAATLLLGVTGGIACGKSTVDAILLELGAVQVIDADAVVHDLLAHDHAVQAAIATRFGDHLVGAAGVDRSALGAVVFADPEALRALEAITHPRVRAYVTAQVALLPSGAVGVIDAVKLLYGPLAELCAQRWWIFASPEQQVTRLMEHRGMSHAAARMRVAVAPRLEDWRARVDVVIDNSGLLAETRVQVERAWTDLVHGD